MNSLFLLAGVAFFTVLAAVIVITIIFVSNKSKSNWITLETAHSIGAVFLFPQKWKEDE